VEKVFGSNLEMGITNIVKCTKCGSLMLTKKGQKTKTCTNCGTKVNLLYAQKVAAADSSFEASEILKILKNEKGFKA
jgi:DnaJ-class molecular chaperone